MNVVNNLSLVEGSVEETADKITSPGNYLRRARESKGISQQEMATNLKITVSKLTALETGDYEQFPSPTYVKGFLRNYSRLLGLDESSVLHSYQAINGDSHEVETPPVMKVPSADNSIGDKAAVQKKWWLVYVVLVIAVLIWGVSYWVLNLTNDVEDPIVNEDGVSLNSEILGQALSESESQDLSGDSSSSVQLPLAISDTPDKELMESVEVSSDASVNDGSAVEAPTDNPPVDLTLEQADIESVDSISLDGSEADAQSSSSQNIGGEESSGAQELLVSKLTASELVKVIAAEKADTEELATNPLVTADILLFNFDNDCWIQVIDSEGKRLISGLQLANSELSLSGEAPFDVVIGNAEGTRVTLNDEPFLLPPPRNNNSLRLKIGG